jgi:O-acetylhomoserine (thiol)-lyase
LTIERADGAKRLATHPASTAHCQLSPIDLSISGVGEDTVRLCVGIEHIGARLADPDTAPAQP